MSDDEPFYSPTWKPTAAPRDGELHMSRRFVLKAAAIQWADSERADIENGWV